MKKKRLIRETESWRKSFPTIVLACSERCLQMHVCKCRMIGFGNKSRRGRKKKGLEKSPFFFFLKCFVKHNKKKEREERAKRKCQDEL
jgi:hypothetical protein